MNINELKEKADEMGVSVLMSVDSGTCKAVLTEHLPDDAEEDLDGMWVTEDHMAYMKIPAVVIK